MKNDSDSDTVPYNEEEGKGEATTNEIIELDIANLDQQEAMSIVTSLLPLCQKVMATDCMAKINEESIAEKNINKNNKISSKSKDRSVCDPRTNVSVDVCDPRTNVEVGMCDPRTNVEVGCENDSSRSNDVTIELINNLLDKAIRKRKMSTKSNMEKKKHKATPEDDEISLHAASDLEKRIDALTKSSSGEISSEEDEFDVKNLRADYLDEDNSGPAVDKDLADLFKDMRESGLSKDKIAQKAKENARPENCNLETKQVNPEIWSNIISSGDRSLDLQLQKSQKLISKASYAILKASNNLLEFKKQKKHKKDKIKEIMKNSTDALALLTTAHNQNEQIRRGLLLKRLAKEQRSLGKDVPKDSKYLFGDDLNKKISEASGIKKLKLRRAEYKKSDQDNRNFQFSKNWERPQKSQRGRQGYRSFKTSSTQRKKKEKQE